MSDKDSKIDFLSALDEDSPLARIARYEIESYTRACIREAEAIQVLRDAFWRGVEAHIAGTVTTDLSPEQLKALNAADTNTETN